MSMHRGDVVLLNAPFVTRTGSKIRPMITARQSQIIRTIGNFPPDVMQQVNDALKASLDIS